MRPLILVVAVEFAVIVLLVVQLFGVEARATVGERPQSSAPAADGGEAMTGEVAPLPAASVVRTVAAPAVPPYRVDDPLGVVVHGVVQAIGGAPVAEARVTFERDGEWRGGQSQANGAYAAAALQPGAWQGTCRAEGFATRETTCTLTDAATQRFDFVLDEVYVVKVRMQNAAGEPVVDVLAKHGVQATPTVIATSEPLPGDLPITEQTLVRVGVGDWHEADAKLREAGFAGELRLHRRPPVHASLLLRHLLLGSQRLEPGQHELAFVLETEDVASKLATVKLRLLDAATGQPLVDAWVAVQTAQGRGSRAKADAEGRCTIVNALPGFGSLQVRVAEYEQPWLCVRVPAGGTLDLGDLALSRLVAVKGRIVDVDDKPVAGVQLQSTDLDRRTWPHPLISRRSNGVSDAEGAFELSALGRHRYVVVGRGSDGRGGFALVDASAGPPPPVTLRFAALTRVALRAQFEFTEAYTVSALTADRTPVDVAWLEGRYARKQLSLPPGDYTIEIHDATDRLVRSFGLQVGSEPLAIDVP